MNTSLGYAKKTLTNSNVLLSGGGDKALSEFIGSLNWDSTNKKLQYKSASSTNFTDLITFGSNAFTSYSGYNIVFQDNAGTTIDTFKALTSPSKTLKAGTNVQMTAASNVITITATNTWIPWVGATASANGTAGYMPAPTSAQREQFLRGDGTWVSLNNYSLPTATSEVLGGVKTGAAITDTTGYTAVAIKDGVIYYKDINNTYTFYNLQFQDSGGTTVDTYKPTTSPTKTLKAGSNVTISAESNVITIASTNTWNANALEIAGYVAAPTKAANANMTWQTDADGNPAWRASNNHTHAYLPLSGGEMTGNITTSSNFMTIGTGQTDAYYRINTTVRHWWLGQGVISGDGKFVIYDASTPRHCLVIDSSGNVGIGNTSPAYKLDVTGTIATGKIHSSASSSIDLTHIPSDSEIALETGNGNGNVSAWVWREKYDLSNWGIFHDNNNDVLHIVGNNVSRFNINLNSGNSNFNGQLNANGGLYTSAYGITVSYSPLNSNLCHIYSNPATSFIFNSNVYCMGNFIDYNTGYSWIHTGNISSQSVNYASSAGNADTVDGYHLLWTDKWGPSDSYTLQNAGLRIQQTNDESSGIQFNGDYINLWSPCDSNYSLRYFDEDSGNEVWNINASGYFSGSAASANYASSAGQVTINYNDDSNSTYQMLWGSGNSVYGTGGIYCNPYTDYLYSGSFYCGNWFRSSGDTGWYNDSYGGGIYMFDSTYVRVYGGKKFYVGYGGDYAIYTAGGFASAKSGGLFAINNGSTWYEDCIYNHSNGNLSINAPGGSLYISYERGNTYFSGGSYYIDRSGNTYFSNYYTTSDRSKKQNISSFSEHIRKFQLKDTEKWHYGVIAQEVPKMFRDGEEGNMTVNYNSVLSYYIGILENKVNLLEQKIKYLENK